MARERQIRSRRVGLTPSKVVFVYFVTFALILFHQSGRLAEWFDDFGAAREGILSDASFSAANFLRTQIEPNGPSWLNQQESSFLTFGATLLNNADSGKSVETVSPDAAPQVSAPPQDLNHLTAAGEELISKIFYDLAASANKVTQEINSGRDAKPDDKTAQEPLPKVKPKKVLLLGDSMMLEGIGPPLQRKLKQIEGLEVVRDGRYGTGLCRLDVFDWMAYFDEMLDKHQPNLVIITLGANDPQDILGVAGKKRIHIGTSQWNEIYQGRVDELAKIAGKRNIDIFWLGLPIMGKEPYGARVATINKLAQDGCSANENCRFWDAWLSVADNKGKYTIFSTDASGKKVRIRAKDSIHLTASGGEIMANKFMEATKDWVDYQQTHTAAAVNETIQRAGRTNSQPDKKYLGDEPEPHSTTGKLEDPAPLIQGPPLPGTAVIGEMGDTAAPPLVMAPSAGDESGFKKIQPQQGLLTEKKLYSQARAKNTSYLVAKPSTRQGGSKQLPVVFLLHGAWDAHKSWLERVGEKKLKQLAASLNIIIIMPDGEPFGWYLDGPESRIETYFMQELLPHILNSEDADPKRIGISGLSMGGHGALTLALKYPEVFKAVSSMSGVMDITVHADQRPINKALKISDLLGEYPQNKEAWLSNSAVELTNRNPEALKKMALLITVGEDDTLTLKENRDYEALLKKLKIKYIYQENQGGHDWDYWAHALPFHLSFIAGHLNK